MNRVIIVLRCVRFLRKIVTGENGQTLSLTLAALMLGILVTAPFLTQAGASIIGSHGYATIIKESYSADAGIEHAIWRLVYDGLDSLIPNVNDNYAYLLPNTVNSIAPYIIVTHTGAGGGVVGAIIDTVIDTLEFDTADAAKPDIIHVSGNIFAIAYTGSGSDGFIKTIEINSNGLITGTVVDTLEFDTGTGLEPTIIHVSGDIFAVAYRGPGSDGFIKTMTINSSGVIGDTVIDTLEFDTSDGFDPFIFHVSGTTYAVAYRGPGNDGFIKSMTIAADGQIGNSVIDTLEYDTANGYEPSVVHVSGDVFAIAYRGTGDDGFLVTVTIAPDGQIGNSVIDTLEFDTSDGYEPCIIHISGNIYAVAYRGPGSDGYIKTIEISTGGLITDTVIDSQVFESGQGYEPSLLHIGGNVYAVAYRDSVNDGWVKTWEIQINGQITDTVIDSLEFDTANGYEPDIINVATDVYAIAYRGTNADGFVVTVGIKQTSGPDSYEIQSVAADCAITATVEINDASVTVISWVVQR